MRPRPAPPQDPTAELQETLDDFGALQKLWLAYKGRCSEGKCPICHENEVDSKEDDKEDGEEDGEEDSEEDSEEDDKEDDKEDEEGDKEFSSSRKSRKGISQRQLDSTGQHPVLQDFDTKKPIQANKRRKKPKEYGERLDDFGSLR